MFEWIMHTDIAFYICLFCLIVGPIIQYSAKGEAEPAEVIGAVLLYFFIYMGWWSAIFVMCCLSALGIGIGGINLLVSGELDGETSVGLGITLALMLTISMPFYYNSAFFTSEEEAKEEAQLQLQQSQKARNLARREADKIEYVDTSATDESTKKRAAAMLEEIKAQNAKLNELQSRF